MATESARLQTRAERLARTADRIGARFARQLAGVLRGLERDILRLGIPEPSVEIAFRAAQSQQLRAQIHDILRRAGYAELIQAATGEPFDRLARQASRIPTVARPDVPLRLESLRQVHLLELLDEGRRLEAELQRQAVRGLVGNVPRMRLIEDLAGTIDRTEAQISTLFDTTLSIYGREVEALQADPSPRTRFVYIGPVDGIIRPFCLRYVGRVLERREIDRLDNGQLGNPFLTGGGYNCRHQWTEISAASDLQALHGAGRIPEVRADVKRQRERRQRRAA